MLNLAVVVIAGALLPAAVAWPLLPTAGCERQVAEVTMQEEVEASHSFTPLHHTATSLTTTLRHQNDSCMILNKNFI